jgi:hypothetical protein
VGYEDAEIVDLDKLLTEAISRVDSFVEDL